MCKFYSRAILLSLHGLLIWLANLSHQISNRIIANEALQSNRILLATANGFANEMAKCFVLAADYPCEWTFATHFSSDCACGSLVHSSGIDRFWTRILEHGSQTQIGSLTNGDLSLGAVPSDSWECVFVSSLRSHVPLLFAT